METLRLQTSLLLCLCVLAGCAASVPTAGSNGAKASNKTAKRNASTQDNQTRTAGSTETNPPIRSVAPSVLSGPTRVVDATTARNVTLTGTVRLISDVGLSLISNHGGGVISNNSSGLVSNNGGGLISNNGGGIVSNQGGQYRTWRLLQAESSKGVASYLLADATVSVRDAAGKTLVGADGNVITAVTDQTGSYKLSAPLPPEGLVAVIQLRGGGTLQAMLTKDALAADGSGTLDLDLSSTLGTTYVLDEFVKGNQTIYDKLPAAEAKTLTQTFQAATEKLAERPDYETKGLLAIANQVRDREKTVKDQLEVIRVLLLGQARLGDGKKAMAIALNGPCLLAHDQAGRVLIGELVTGRIRRVLPDGTVDTLFDAVQGEVKGNAPQMGMLKLGADGTVLTAGDSDKAIYRIATGGALTKIAFPPGFVSPAVTALPDGRVVIGQFTGNKAARVGVIGADGAVTDLTASVPWTSTRVQDVAADAAGNVYAYIRYVDGLDLYKLEKGATNWTLLKKGLPLAWPNGRIHLGPNGTVYATTREPYQIIQISPTGEVSPLAKVNPPAMVEEGRRDFLVQSDGTVLMTDAIAGLVWRFGPNGLIETFAGVGAGDQSGDGGQLALSGPTGVVFADDGAMLFSEIGTQAVRRYKDGVITTVAGGNGEGFRGDGGPAKEAALAAPSGLALDGSMIWIVDWTNKRIRRVTPDGTIDTLAGGGSTALRADTPLDAKTLAFGQPAGIVIGKAAHPVICDLGKNQLLALDDQGKIRLLAGQADGKPGDSGDGAAAKLARISSPFQVIKGPDGALYFSDAGNLRVRRIVDPYGENPIIETFAGRPTADTVTRLKAGEPLRPASIDRQSALLGVPVGLCFDAEGNLYVTEIGTLSLTTYAPYSQGIQDLAKQGLPSIQPGVRKIAKDGTTTVFAGPGGKFMAEGSTEDPFVCPTGMAIDPNGNLAIVDTLSNQIHRFPVK